MKKKNDSIEIEKAVLEFLRRSPDDGFKFKELAGQLAFRKHEQERLGEILSDMVLRGILDKRKKKYSLKASELIGTVSVNKNGEGFVAVEGFERDFFVAPPRLKTALDGDRVLIVALNRKGRARGPEAQVIRVLERRTTRLVGTFETEGAFAYVRPDNLRMPRDIVIPDDARHKARHGQKVVIELDAWDNEHLNPQGKVVEILGYPFDKGVDVLSVVKGHDLHFGFPRDVEAHCGRLPDRIAEEEIARRLDLRDVLTVTIDPFDAKDFDDAVSLEELENGHSLLGVHIADVSHYVHEGTPLDREAYKRGTSTYLVDQVIPMLPERLSNHLCSLRPDEDRLAYSILMEMDTDGNVLDYDIVETVIHSRRRLTYEEVQGVLDGKPARPQDPKIVETLQRMNALAKRLTAKRIADGGIEFDTPETKFRLDERGNPVECFRKDRLDSHRLVEEFMLAANQTAASHIGRLPEKAGNGGVPFLYRVHDRPPVDKLENFTRLIKVFGYVIPRHRGSVQSSHIQRIMEQVKGKKEQILLEKVAIRSMAKAEYSPENIGHFGLAFNYYTHFTSPIRRYPDLIVHRLLKELDTGMTHARVAFWADRLPEVARHCSEREKIATEAERDSVKVKQVQFMIDRVGEEYDGIVSGVMAFGIFVEIPEYLIEGLIHIRDLDDDYYTYDENRYRLIGKRSKRVYQLGDAIRIRVVAVSPERQEIDFAIADA